MNLKAENITFAYNKTRQILKDVSLTLPSDKIIGLIGDSGSGKSTLAHGMKAEVIELDDLITNWNFDDSQLKAYSNMLYSFFTGPGKKYRISLEYLKENEIPESKYEVPLVKDFISYAKSYAKSHKNKKLPVQLTK